MRRFYPLAIALTLLTAGVASAADHQPVGGWEIRAPLPIDLYGGAAASDGTYAYVAGGYSLSMGEPLDTLFRFDDATNTWTTLAPMPMPALMASAVYHPPTNKIYVFGGEDGENGTNYAITRIYDIATNTWTTGTEMPDIRSFMASAYNPLDQRSISSGATGTARSGPSRLRSGPTTPRPTRSARTVRISRAPSAAQALESSAIGCT